MNSNLVNIFRVFPLYTKLSGIVVHSLLLATALFSVDAAIALTAEDVVPIPARFSCAEMGLDPNQRYPFVHNGGCIGEVPYRGVNLPNRTNCSVDRQYSCFVGEATVCVRTINCNDGQFPDTSCDAPYRCYQ